MRRKDWGGMIIIMALIWTDSHSSAGPVCTSKEATGCAAKHKYLGPATISVTISMQCIPQNEKGHFNIYPDSIISVAKI